jgi:hypothetical protein
MFLEKGLMHMEPKKLDNKTPLVLGGDENMGEK